MIVGPPTFSLGDREFADLISQALGGGTGLTELGDFPDFEALDNVQISTFEDAGVMTNNAGLVVRLDDGTEFQVTVVRSR